METPISTVSDEWLSIDSAARRRLFERRLFAATAIIFPLIVVVGFAPTYYLRGLFDGPPLSSTIVHAHGALMTAWVALFATQVWLVSSKRVRIHQRLGYAGVALAVLIILIGFVTTLYAAKYSATFAPPGLSPLPFTIIPLFDLLMFALLLGGAVYFRKVPSMHKRLILLTALNFLPPAVARIPIAPLQAAGPLWFFGCPALIAVACVALDTWHHKTVNRVFLIGSIALIASYVARLAIMQTDAWLNVAQRLVALVP